MPLRDGRLPVLSSVFDRLTDGPSSGSIGSVRAGTLAALRDAVRSDLERLLNVRREERLVPAGYPESAASLLNYGLPDLSVYSLKNPADQQKLRRAMEAALRTFEPRLSQLSVTIEGWDEARPVLRFRVEAVLRVEPVPEPVTFDTELWLENSRFSIMGRPR
jgi:type VI secretion system protein ImpF